MSDPSKALRFGSFSEDETHSLLHQKPSNFQKPGKWKGLLVNPPNLGLTFGNFSDKSGLPVGFPSGPGETEPNTILKGNKNLIKKSHTEKLPIPSENGKVHSSTHSPHGNELVDGSTFRALQLSGDNDKKDGKSIPKSQDHECVVLNGRANDSAVETHKEEAHPKKDLPVLDAQDLRPRGLINSGNLCFLNAILQALLACSPFVQLLLGLRKWNIPKVGYPTLAAFSEFIGEFDAVDGSNIKNKNSTKIEAGRPFSPTMFEALLRKFTPDVSSSTSGRHRQEDAQEFLSFIMEQMHVELLKLGGSDGRSSSLVSTSEDDEWETVGPKNKSAVTRTQSFVPSELTSIFGGELRSIVKARGNKPSATVQPFFLLHLDISHKLIETIEDALRLYSAPETLDEYRASTGGKVGVVAAKKSINIKALPKIMILHLKRFGYGCHGSTKLHKAVHFPLELVLNRDLLVSSNMEGRKYELVATVTHHGKEASKGHYTADVRQANGQWLRCDDSSLTVISLSKVLQQEAYVLFYKQALKQL